MKNVLWNAWLKVNGKWFALPGVRAPTEAKAIMRVRDKHNPLPQDEVKVERKAKRQAVKC